MAKILVRSHVKFGENHTPSEVLIRNLIGNNTGNYIFMRSVIRTLMVTDDTEIESIRFNRARIPKEEIEYYNNECSAFIIPLANPKIIKCKYWHRYSLLLFGHPLNIIHKWNPFVYLNIHSCTIQSSL